MEYGLIGEKLNHSYSKEIHEAFGDYRYDLMELSRAELGAFLKARSFRAVNVTIPYKEAVFPELDHLSERASAVGAVNTIVNRGGRLFGYNTDFTGMTALIRKAGISLFGKKTVILGTGGTSKTAGAVCRSMGARELVFVSRKRSPGAITYEEIPEYAQDADVLVNATPVGMWPDEENEPVRLAAFPALSGVIDVIYHPLRTGLLLEAGSFGIPNAGGLYMLAAQAAEAFLLFTGRRAEECKSLEMDGELLELTEKAYRKVLSEKQNLVLIGMPSAGKSLAGQLVSRMTGRPFINTDDLGEERLGEPIPGFIRREGEAAFRAFEREAVQSLSKKEGCIIATGGGAVLDQENVKALKREGKLIFLYRDLQALQPMEDRPLSDTPGKLAEMFERRRPVYESAADETVRGCEDPEETARAVMRAFYGNEEIG
ncbi:MAG: shikimate dehydrogenase [Lachnospiraceae bacterium]|nr:shikimate dehydrogenase [Lachnospiraceae bacterium]